MCIISPRGSVVKCLTRNPGILGSSRTGSSAFFRGIVLGQDTSEPSLVLVTPRKDMNNVSCRRDMTEIGPTVKSGVKNHSLNQSILLRQWNTISGHRYFQ